MSINRSKERTSLCSFSFADGRQCRSPRCSSHPHLCGFHARREAQDLAALKVGRDISDCFSGGYISACDLSTALGHLFSAVAQRQIKPRAATTLAYLGQTLLQSIHLAQHEYINAFDTEAWRRVVRSGFQPPPPAEPRPKPEPLPTTREAFKEAVCKVANTRSRNPL